MSDTIMLKEHENNTSHQGTLVDESGHITLTNDLEKLLIAAQPRLAQLAVEWHLS